MPEREAGMADFTGQAVLITGAGTGIGAAIARAFLSNGATLAATYHGNADGARRLEEAACTAGRLAPIRPVDARDVGQFDAFVAEAIQTLGHVDILVYNSGLTDPQPLFDLTEEQWDSTLDINLKGMFFCARAVAAHMRERGYPGSIVLLSSVHSIQAYHAHAHYAASKGGINMLTRSLAFSRPTASASTLLPRGRSTWSAITASSTLRRWANISPWDASAGRRRWPRSPSSSPLRRRRTSPAMCSSPMGGSRYP